MPSLDPLDNLTAELEELGGAFSVVNPSSSASSTRPSSRASSATARRSTGGESFLFSTPMSGGGASVRSAGTGGVGGGGVNAGKVVFLTEEDIGGICCGKVGTVNPNRFCLAPKGMDMPHCGIKSHERKRFEPAANAYYAPGAPSRGKATAFMAPYLAGEALPDEMRPEFNPQLQRSSEDWIALIDEANVTAASISPRARSALSINTGIPHGVSTGPSSAPMGTTPEETKAYDSSSDDDSADPDMDEDADKYSPPRVINKGDWEVDFAPLDRAWNPSLFIDDAAAWAPPATNHQAVLKELIRILKVVAGQVPSVGEQLEQMLWRNPGSPINKRFGEVETALSSLDTRVGDDEDLVSTHGTISNAVSHALATAVAATHTADSAATKSAEASSLAQDALAEISNAKLKLAEGIRKISRSLLGTLTRLGNLEARVEELDDSSPADELESLLEGDVSGTTRLAEGTTATSIHADTTLGAVNVGGSDVSLSPRSLFASIRALEANLEELQGNAKNGGGSFSFDKWSWSSADDFSRLYTQENVGGRAPASMVDMLSVWAHAGLGTSESHYDWLQTHHKATGAGFVGVVETAYAASFRSRYSKVFVGTKTEVLPTEVIHLFSSLAVWRGTGCSDGTKERLISSLRLAVERHRGYCNDNLPEGQLRRTAIQSGIVTERVLQSLMNHFDDQITMLSSLGLEEKRVMLLVSHQLTTICDELYKYRQMAADVDFSDRGATACRFAMVTAQALSKMEEYVRAGQNHPVFLGSFSRFLTQQIAANQASNLSKDIASLKSKVTAVEKEVNKGGEKGTDTKSLKKELDKLDSKVDTIIRLNSLKKKE